MSSNISFEYEYCAEFTIPYRISGGIAFEKKYELDATTFCWVICAANQTPCCFKLVSKTMVSEPNGHDPDQYRRHAPHSDAFYNVLHLCIAYTLGHLVGHESQIGFRDEFQPPSMNHNFEEKAKDAGIAVPKRISCSFNFPFSVDGLVTEATLEKIGRFAQVLSEERRNWPLTTASPSPAKGPKASVLHFYRMGLISAIGPYPYWYQALETMRNARYGFTELSGLKKTDKEVNLCGMKIDWYFLWNFPNCFRHSEHNASSIHIVDWQQFMQDPSYQKYFADRSEADKYYREGFRALIDHFILKC
jgi:hypothetical protein